MQWGILALSIAIGGGLFMGNVQAQGQTPVVHGTATPGGGFPVYGEAYAATLNEMDATLSVQTKVITDGHPLLDYLPGPSSFAWVRNGNGLVAWGESARIVVNGRERFSRAQRWWSAVVRASGAKVD